MVLNDVPNCARFFVKLSPAFDAEIFGQRDLDRADVGAIPDRLEEQVGKTGIENILYRFFTEKMVDTKDRRLRKEAVQNTIELLRRIQIPSKWFLHHHASVGGASGLSQPSATGPNMLGGIAR